MLLKVVQTEAFAHNYAVQAVRRGVDGKIMTLLYLLG